jgi:hypothetical protein
MSFSSSSSSRIHHRRSWHTQSSINKHAPCYHCFNPKVQSCMLVVFGFILHIVFTTTWSWYAGIPSCNDPSTRELLWFFEDVQHRKHSHHNSGSVVNGNVEGDGKTVLWRDVKPIYSVLDQPAAKVFSDGIAVAVESNLDTMYQSFQQLGIDVKKKRINQDEYDVDSRKKRREDHERMKKEKNKMTLQRVRQYTDAVGTLRFRHGESADRWGSMYDQTDSSGFSGVSGSTVLDTLVRSTNVITNQLKTINMGLDRLVQYRKKKETAEYTGSDITIPDRFTEVVNNLAIVITWVNGSDPTTVSRRKKRCYEYYGYGARHCRSSAWRVDRIRETGELLYALRAIETNMPWFKGMHFLYMFYLLYYSLTECFLLIFQI